MAGRGFLLKPLKTKDDDKESEVAPSMISSSGTPFLTIGRGAVGRGISLPVYTPKPPESVSSIGIGRGVAGRGMFAVKIKHPTSSEQKTTNSDPIISSFEGSSSKNADTQKSAGPSSSGIIAGRGLASSAKGSSGLQKISTSSHSGAVERAEREVENVDQALKEISVTTSLETEEVEPVLKHGEKGKTFNAMCNAIELHCDPEAGVFEYEVRFAPVVDNMSYRFKYLNQHKEVIGEAKTFDGVILFLPRKLNGTITKFTSTNMVEGESSVNVEIIFKRKKRLGECIQLYNVLFNRIFKILDYKRVGRKMFNPRAPLLVPQHKLEIWPGYVTSVDELEKGLMLTLDVSHRVLMTRTVLEVFSDAYRSNSNTWKEEVKKAVIGK